MTKLRNHGWAFQKRVSEFVFRFDTGQEQVWNHMDEKLKSDGGELKKLKNLLLRKI